MTEDTRNQEGRRFKPSDYLKARRPERYSDSIVREVPELTRKQLEYHLETLTSRSQEKEFEYFARKLAEKKICPNLIPQTGPTGGGDSKTDTETYPVDESIAITWYQGSQSANERWAFAFSAKKKWSDKVREDVKGIIGTGRDYTLIYFISNQFISDKQRAAREDALSKEFSIPVRILSREWIIEQVFEHDCEHIVEQTLSIDGLQLSSRKTLGPNDARRQIELEELDKSINTPDRYAGVEYQLAEDILEGAGLASELERHRHEVDGRFAAALRVAEKVGDTRQILRIYYKQAWTACFTYNDLQELSKIYDRVLEVSLASEYADDAEYATTLLNVLISSASLGNITPENANIDERSNILLQHLTTLSENDARLNNAYKAKAQVCLLKLALILPGHDETSIDHVFSDLNEVIIKSVNLGEFPFESYKDLIMELGENITTNHSYNQLLDTVISIVEKRSSEGDAGAMLVDRAIQIAPDNHFEAIKILGRAQEKLIKDEYVFDLVKSLLALGYTYDEADLKWAARTSYLAVLSKTISEFNKSGYMHHFAYMAVKQLVNIELKLGRLPHVLFALLLANHIRKNARINDEEFIEFFQTIDAIITILILRANEKQLITLTKLRARLDDLSLVCSEGGLLFALGYYDELKEDVWFEDTETDEKIDEFYQIVYAQPANQQVPKSIELGNQETTVISSIILGTRFSVTMQTNPISLLIAESILGAMEAFLATSLSSTMSPHREMITIEVMTVDEMQETTGIQVKDDSGSSDLQIQHDKKFNLDSHEKLSKFRDFIAEFIALCLPKFIIMNEPDDYIEALAREERCFSRALLFSDVFTLSENVFGGLDWINIERWQNSNDKDYPYMRQALWTPDEDFVKKFSKPVKRGKGSPEKQDFPNLQKHSDRKVLSVINIPLWDRAKWSGTLFLVVPTHEIPPAMGFLFKEEEAAIEIFREWNHRFGNKDDNDQIKIVIITGIDIHHPAHYRVFVGSNIEKHLAESEDKQIVMISRYNTMTPESSINLERFIKSYNHFGLYALMPSVSKKDNTQPHILQEHYILKRNLVIRPAWKIAENDDELMAIHPDDEPIIPSNIEDAPIIKTLEKVRRMKRK